MLITKPLNIRADHAEIIHRILKDNLEEGTYVFAFGSRANWTAKQSSDLDLGVDSFGVKLDKKIKSNLEDAFEESDLPYKVDAVDLNSVSESFREAIQDQLVRVLWDWNEYQLKDCCQINPKVILKSNLSYPFVDMQSITPFTKFVHARTSKKFTGGGAKFQNGDVLMARITPCLENGKCSQYITNSDVDVAFGSTEFIVLRSEEHITNQSFIYYLSISNLIRKEAISLMTGTSGRQRVDLEGFREINITIPPLPEQKRIAEILSSLDNKIEINKQINKTLEEMAEALFKSWFIDFDPVRVKKAALEAGADEEGANLAVMKFISSKTEKELEKFQNDYPDKHRELEDVAKLFPAEFQDSELGEVPLGWRVEKIGQLVNITSSKRIFHSDYVTLGVPFYRSKEIIEKHKGNEVSSELYITKEKFQSIKDKFGIPEHQDILLTSVGTLGIPYMVKETEVFYFKDGNLTWFKDYNGIDPGYLYYFFLSPVGKKCLKAITIGSTQSALTIAGLKTIPIIFCEKIMIQFSSINRELFRKMNRNLSQITLLCTLRKDVLPKLMNGEIRVRK
jgi:type I restriction enzyme S subunit